MKKHLLMMLFLLLLISGLAAGCGMGGNNTSSDNEPEGIENNDTENATEKNDDSSAMANSDCPDPDEFGPRQILKDDFYFPECTIQVVYSTNDENIMKGIYHVEGGDHEEIAAAYKTYFGADLDEEIIEDDRILVTAYILGNDTERTKVRIKEPKDNIVEIAIYGNDNY